MSEILKEVSLEEMLFFKEMGANSSIKAVYYKEVEDERIDKVFKDFNLASIDKGLDESVDFC